MILDLTGLHPTFERPVADTLRSLSADYPAAPLERVGLFEGAGDDSMADASRPGEILLNARWFARPIEELRELARERNVVYLHWGKFPVHWHGDMEEPHHVLTHEFGHKLQECCDWARLAVPNWEQSCADPENCRPVSGYALASPDEWWADVFAAMRLGLGGESVRLMREFLQSL